jgi:phosphoribosylformimino-5-aminoimidazole carboxamide ribotide isomerase
MRIYPAIDIKDGKCVRLLQGRFSDVTVYGDNPVEMAKKWESEGGEYLHVVDLDGALKGHGVNAEVISGICSSLNIPVQTGGGIRTMQDIEDKLSCGISRVIIGTSAVKDADFVRRALDKYGDKIVIGIDAKDSMVAIEGWEEISSFGAVDFAKKMESLGASAFVYTDIATDGTLKGPNTEAMKEMSAAVRADVIASGGIGNIGHVKELTSAGVEGVIIGRALYAGTVDLSEAVREGKNIKKGF